MKDSVLWLFGQPGSGKTTFAKHFIEQKKLEGDHSWVHVDADIFRQAYNNFSYDRQGRLANVTAAVNTVNFLLLSGYNVVASFVTPYLEMRQMIRAAFDKKLLVHVKYAANELQRGREDRWVKDFEDPANDGEGYLVTFDTGRTDMNAMYNYLMERPFFKLHTAEKMN